MPIASEIPCTGAGPRDGSFGGPGRSYGKEQVQLPNSIPLPPSSSSSWEDMEYAGGLQLCGLPDGVIVRNTFIDYPAARAGTFEAYEVENRGWRSCPPTLGLPEEGQEKQKEQQHAQRQAGQNRVPSDVQSSVILEHLEEDPPSELELSFSTDSGEEVDGVEDRERPRLLLLDQLPRPEPVFSEGSIPHQLGQICRPCGFAHKPEGCSNGAQCQYCHLCLPGEIKDRKKTKKVVMRKARDFAFARRRYPGCYFYGRGPTKVSV